MFLGGDGKDGGSCDGARSQEPCGGRIDPRRGDDGHVNQGAESALVSLLRRIVVVDACHQDSEEEQGRKQRARRAEEPAAAFEYRCPHAASCLALSLPLSTYFMRTVSETMATVTPNRQTMVAPIGQSRR